MRLTAKQGKASACRWKHRPSVWEGDVGHLSHSFPAKTGKLCVACAPCNRAANVAIRVRVTTKTCVPDTGLKLRHLHGGGNTAQGCGKGMSGTFGRDAVCGMCSLQHSSTHCHQGASDYKCMCSRHRSVRLMTKASAQVGTLPQGFGMGMSGTLRVEAVWGMCVLHRHGVSTADDSTSDVSGKKSCMRLPAIHQQPLLLRIRHGASRPCCSL